MCIELAGLFPQGFAPVLYLYRVLGLLVCDKFLCAGKAAEKE